MTFRKRFGLLWVTACCGMLLAWAAARAMPAALAARVAVTNQQITAPTPLPDQPVTHAPAISSIDAPTPACVLPRPGTDACYIVWSYLLATANPSYIISMTVEIDEQPRGRYQGFFQTAMYVPTEMLSFRVSCGVPGSSEVVGTGEDPNNWGLRHSYAVRGRDSAGMRTANYGSVVCPADQVALAALSLDGPSTGKLGLSYTFTADVTPITATLPISYSWSASENPTYVEVAGPGSNRSFSWDSYGLKTVQVTISNPVSSLALTDTILIEPYTIYNPLMRKSP
jgi:hypothetical protein